MLPLMFQLTVPLTWYIFQLVSSGLDTTRSPGKDYIQDQPSFSHTSYHLYQSQPSRHSQRPSSYSGSLRRLKHFFRFTKFFFKLSLKGTVVVISSKPPFRMGFAILPLNLFLINNVKDIVVFQLEKCLILPIFTSI